MKRVLLCLVVALTSLWTVPLLHALDHAPLKGVAEAQQDPSTLTVYVTRTGEKYHRDGCRYLRQSRIATTLKDAVTRGFGPCSVCKPPS